MCEVIWLLRLIFEIGCIDWSFDKVYNVFLCSNIDSFLEQKVEATHQVLYLDLFSMDESKEPDLCNIRVDRIGTPIIFLYSGKGCTFPWGCYMKRNRDDGTVVKSCFLWSKSAQVSLHDVWFVQCFTHHFHSCYFFLQLESWF